MPHKHWKTEEELIANYLAKGYVVGLARCNICQHEMKSLHPKGTDATKLECPKCGMQDSTFTETKVARSGGGSKAPR